MPGGVRRLRRQRPALGYDDYAAGVDVKGKVVAYLSGAPAMLPATNAPTIGRVR